MADTPAPFTLHYRAGFATAMLACGLLMTLGGVFIVIGSLVLFRPAAIFAGIFMAIGGIRLLRRYAGAFRRRNAAFDVTPEGISFLGPQGYHIRWSDVLGLHVCRRRGKAYAIYIYLSENPSSALFIGDTDPRAALFTAHRAESPHQLHLRLSHFNLPGGGEIEAAFRALAPRNGAFPPPAKILNGHFSELNWMLLGTALSLIFTTTMFAILYGDVSNGTLALVCGLMLAPILFAWGLGQLRRRSPNWATPRLIAYNGMLYVPAAPLGAVKLSDIINVRRKMGMLMLYFATCQERVRDYQFNTLGLFAQIRITTQGNTRAALAAYFTALHLWETGKTLNYKKIRAEQKQRRQDMKRRTQRS
ncbi:hypothetical protein [Acidocella sp. MX-AZ02]|uniref:hypothetical protein n=2 Tax=unclassified Acidocella TaxID=2648610 RepID=UPI00028D70B3|nr:hypothetical protein [Acidocella sp. MX-AZ02]EKM98848.1 hypothetical protein MXAZACID_13451 [Acidocella sp. MX-AZ02]